MGPRSSQLSEGPFPFFLSLAVFNAVLYDRDNLADRRTGCVRDRKRIDRKRPIYAVPASLPNAWKQTYDDAVRSLDDRMRWAAKDKRTGGAECA